VDDLREPVGLVIGIRDLRLAGGFAQAATGAFLAAKRPFTRMQFVAATE